MTYTSKDNSSVRQTRGIRGSVVLQHPHTPVHELCHWTRFAKERGSDFAVICHPGSEEMLAEVHDESLASLDVYLDDLDALAVGTEVDIVFDGEFFRARVRQIEPHETTYLVGFDCERGLARECE